MRASLLHPLGLGERRHARRPRSRRRTQPVQRKVDPALQRAREAGGPVDEASYACPCGCIFVASVSTDVACPHCHVTQAW